MTLEQKAEAYDKAIEKIKYVMEQDVSAVLNKEDLLDIFPELREFEDEIMRKYFIMIFRRMLEEDNLQPLGTVEASKLLTWLEKQAGKDKLIQELGKYKVKYTQEILSQQLKKQGEQKTADKVEAKFNVGDTMRTLQEANNGYTDGMPVVVSIDNEYYHCTNELIAIKDQDDYEFPPINVKQKTADNTEQKFHEGEWVIYKNDICQIVKREEGCNKLVTVFGIEKELVNERNLSTSRLWTIEDARDGDVLTYKNDDIEWILIYKNILPEYHDVPNHVLKYHALFTGTDFYHNRINSIKGKNYASCFTPATKEQRDLLFQKMKEAGYEWDAEKKELKRFEKQVPKPTWSEEDNRNYLSIIEYTYQEIPLNNKQIAWLVSVKQRMEE